MRNLLKRVAVYLGVGAVAAAGNSALLNYVMPNARTVLGIRVDRIRDTPFGKAALAQLQADPRARSLLDEGGIEVVRQLREVIIASPGDSEEPPVLIMVQGAFNPALLRLLAGVTGAAAADFEGVPMLIPPSKTPSAIAMLGTEFLIAGDRASVERAISRRGQPEGITPRLAEQIEGLRGRFDIWVTSSESFASLAGNMADSGFQTRLKNSPLEAVEQFQGGIRIGRDLQVSAEMTTRTEKDAAELAVALRFLGSLMQSNPKLALISGAPVQLSVDSRTVRFSLSISQEQFRKAIEKSTGSRGLKAARIPGAPNSVTAPVESLSPLLARPRDTDVMVTSSDGTIVSTPDSGETMVVTLPGAR